MTAAYCWGGGLLLPVKPPFTTLGPPPSSHAGWNGGTGVKVRQERYLGHMCVTWPPSVLHPRHPTCLTLAGALLNLGSVFGLHSAFLKVCSLVYLNQYLRGRFLKIIFMDLTQSASLETRSGVSISNTHTHTPPGPLPIQCFRTEVLRAAPGRQHQHNS